MYESMLTHRLRRELDAVFGAGLLPAGIRSVGSFPAINIGTTPETVEVYAFAPGIDPAKVEVTLDRGVLTLSGERLPSVHEGAEKSRTHSRERAGGRFTRAVSLPDDIDPSRVNASYRDGVLQVSIARNAAAQPQRITVQ